MLPANRKPSAISNAKLPVIREVQENMSGIQPGTKAYRMGKCFIIVSPPMYESHKMVIDWHLSISCRDRYPTWDEIVKVRYELLPAGLTFAMLLPPVSEYVNIHENCFQLHVVEGGDRLALK